MLSSDRDLVPVILERKGIVRVKAVTTPIRLFTRLIRFLTGWFLRDGFSKKAEMFLRLPKEVFFIGDGELVLDLAKQEKFLSNKPYSFFGLDRNLGDHAMMVSDFQSQENTQNSGFWEHSHNALAQIFSRRTIKVKFEDLIRSEIKSSLEDPRFVESEALYVKKFANHISQSAIFKAVTGQSISSDLQEAIFRRKGRSLRTVIEEVSTDTSNFAFNGPVGLALRAYQDKSDLPLSWLLDQIANLFNNGTVTLQETLAYALLRLADDPDAQENYLNSGESPARENFINEVLRSRSVPPAIVTRLATEDLKVGNYLIPEGSWIVLWSWAVHENSNDWDTPESFSPDRFEAQPKREGSLRSCPFGFGRRICIGRHFAMLELELAIEETLSKYRLSSSQNRAIGDSSLSEDALIGLELRN